MRCLNCHTIVADTDPCCMSCGARCTTTVREESKAGKPLPVIAGVMLLVGMTCGYATQGSPGEHPLKDRAALRDRTTVANVWALSFFFVGLGGDAIRWSLQRRQENKTPPAVTALTSFSGPQKPSPATAEKPAQIAIAARPAPARFAGDLRPQPTTGYSGLVRFIFAGVWAAGFFIVAMVLAAIIVVSITGNDPEQKQWSDEIGKTIVPWIFFGSIFSAGTLSVLGKLPGTRSRTVLSSAR